MGPFRYPPARECDQVDDYHGTPIRDPYRWLEDPDADESRRWIEAENALTQSFLSGISARTPLAARIRELWNYERWSVPSRRGKYWFQYKNDGLQNQAVLYKQTALDAPPAVLFDPNLLSADGTIALGGVDFTEDGALMAYGLSEAGSDWVEWRVREVATGVDREDLVRWSKFCGAAWSRDNAGFYYSRYPEPSRPTGGAAFEEANYHHKLYYHRLGRPQAEDELIYEDPAHKERGVAAVVSEDGDYLVLGIWEGTDRRNRLYYSRIGGRGGVVGPVVKLLDAMDASYEFLGNVGTRFYLKTDREAPRGRVVALEVENPDAPWTEIIAEGPDKLEYAVMLGGGIVAGWLKDAHSRVTFHALDGRAPPRELPLPGIGSASGFTGRSGDRLTFYAHTSFTQPTSIYRLDLAAFQSSVFWTPAMKFSPDDFETTQVFYPAKGTDVPLFVVKKKGTPLDGENPTYLYGYGGFNISMTPAFSVGLVAWLERGGVFAQACLRGGGERGEEWHQAGMLERKQTVFDDFAAAAEYLVRTGVTRPDRLAIGGGSNGGLLVGASITQRPELFGAALIQVGVLDMLRFHRFTIGHAWKSEYGSADDPAQFEVLLRYSPLHNLKPGTHYPPTLIMTGDHDDRVVPAHSFKFAAALQKAQGGSAPILIRIETDAGHGAGKPTAMLIAEAADRWAFLEQVLGRPAR
jgi:prolyl oligopeptidase